MKIFTKTLIIITLLTCNSIFAQNPGQPDLSFNGVGYYTHDFGNTDNINDVTLQSDGKILATGVALNSAWSGELKVLRLNADGTPDLSFGTNGVYAYPSSDETYGVSCRQTASGKIIVGGIKINITGNGWADMLLICLDANGDPDPAFGTNGVVIADFSGFDDFLQAIDIQDDGKIVVSGTTAVLSGSDIFNAPSLARFLPDGQVDSSFGVNGLLVFPATFIDNELSSCIVQDDGKIVASGHFDMNAGGSANFDLLLVRTNANGTPDNSFGTNGMVKTPVNGGVDDAFGMDIDNSGNIIVGGFTTVPVSLGFDMILAKYLSDGTLDVSFGNQGLVQFDSLDYDVAYDLKVQADDKIVLAGAVGGAAGMDANLAIWRYNTDGTPDVTFGGNGLIISSVVPGNRHEFNSLLIQPDEKIVAGGKYRDATNNQNMIVYRYHGGTSSGINEASSTGLSVYPNPSRGLIHFDLGKYHDDVLRIYNCQGQLVFSHEVREASFSITPGLSQGLYYYTLGSYSGKIAISK